MPARGEAGSPGGRRDRGAAEAASSAVSEDFVIAEAPLPLLSQGSLYGLVRMRRSRRAEADRDGESRHMDNSDWLKI